MRLLCDDYRKRKMKNTYTKEKGCFDSWDDYIEEELHSKEKEPTLFHVGQSYEDTPSKKIICGICGGDKFNVGQGNCFTAIRCVKCEWESGIHEG